uniref:ribosomal protein S9 n=1 Tax=Phacus arnoldii TaxID=298292 RepID=UPI0023AA7900|nr:ribosomal protein S9 [Phacus arnoldii]WCH63586.1 ribosomal protein S9 [Phacus arnoldii]
MNTDKNLKSVGRRKCAIANVKVKSGTGNIIINNRDLSEYFQYNPKYEFIFYNFMPLILLNIEENYDIFVILKGGGISGQSEAIKLAISRVVYPLVEDISRNNLRINGFLTRNSLCKERKSKYGLKKARKAPQFSKR